MLHVNENDKDILGNIKKAFFKVFLIKNLVFFEPNTQLKQLFFGSQELAALLPSVRSKKGRAWEQESVEKSEREREKDRQETLEMRASFSWRRQSIVALCIC